MKQTLIFVSTSYLAGFATATWLIFCHGTRIAQPLLTSAVAFANAGSDTAYQLNIGAGATLPTLPVTKETKHPIR